MPRTRALIVAIAIAVAVGMAGCTPGAPAATTRPGDTGQPSAAPLTASPASRTEQPTPTAVPEPSPTTPPEASVIEGDLVLQVDDINPEMGPAFAIALLSVYADGSVIIVVADDRSPRYGRARYDRLSESGLRTVLEVAGGARTLRTSDPAGNRLATLESWLPSSAWDVAPALNSLWVPARYLIGIRVRDDGRRFRFDVDDVWPRQEPFASFGEPIAGDRADPPDRPARCGVVASDEALQIQGAFGLGPGLGVPFELSAWGNLSWAAESASVSLVIEALAPHEPGTCEMLHAYP